MKTDKPSLLHSCLAALMPQERTSKLVLGIECSSCVDQVFEAQCVGLSCIQFICRLCFSGDGIQLYIYI